MRKKDVKKNPLLVFSLSLVFWALLVIQILFVDPELVKDLLFPSAYLTFFIPLLLALFFAFGIFLNRRRSLLISLTAVVFLYLRLFGFGHILNLVLVVSIAFSLELYFHFSQK